MTRPLINLILPLLFIVSIGTILYAIAIFVRAAIRGSKTQKVKAGKIIILPLVYVIGMLSFFYIQRNATYEQAINNLNGTYNYYADSSNNENRNSFTQIKLNSDQTFSYANKNDTSFTGIWKPNTQVERVAFYDMKGNLLWNAQWKRKNKETLLIVIQAGKQLFYTKSN